MSFPVPQSTIEHIQQNIIRWNEEEKTNPLEAILGWLALQASVKSMRAELRLRRFLNSCPADRCHAPEG
jgi:hypothetical protein